MAQLRHPETVGAFTEETDLSFDLHLSSTQPTSADLADDLSLSRWSVRLTGYADNPDDGHELAVGIATLIRDARYDARFYDRMDELDADHEIIGAALREESGAASSALFEDFGIDFGGDVLFVDRVSVPQAHRGHGYSHLLVDSAARALAPDGIIALQPMPPGDRSAENVAGLRRHWASGGFVERAFGIYVRASVPVAPR